MKTNDYVHGPGVIYIRMHAYVHHIWQSFPLCNDRYAENKEEELSSLYPHVCTHVYDRCRITYLIRLTLIDERSVWC